MSGSEYTEYFDEKKKKKSQTSFSLVFYQLHAFIPQDDELQVMQKL
jgi:hypothetical protein